MLVVLGAFAAGALTTLAPCVLPLLPIIVGGSLHNASAEGTRTWLRPVVVASALGVSIVVFTLLLKVSTAALDIPTDVWQWVSGGLLILLGLVNLFPQAWTVVAERFGFAESSNTALQKARSREGVGGAVLTGAALGPVFTSCSPMYGYVVVTALPASFGYGMVLLAAYVLGLCGVLLAIALAGRKLIAKLQWAADPSGWFRRTLGLVFVLIGVAIVFGFHKTAETWVLDHVPMPSWIQTQDFIPLPED